MEQTELIALLNAYIKAKTSNQRNRNNLATEASSGYLKDTKATVNRSIIAELDASYNKDGLQELAKYARRAIGANKLLIESLGLNMPYSLLLNTDPTTISKAQLIWGVAVVFCNAEVYKLFRAELPPDLQDAAEKLTWLNKVKADVLGQLIGVEMTTSTGNNYYSGGSIDLKSNFKILPHTGGGWNGNVVLSWPPAIRSFLQTIYPQPAEYTIKTIAHPMPDWTVWEEGEMVIFEELQKLLAYRMQDNIPINNSGKVSGTSFKKMRKMLAVKEFFGLDSPYPFVRTACLAQILASFEPKKNQAFVDSLELLRFIYKTIPKHLEVVFLLNELKNHGHINFYYYKQEAELALIEWLNRLPIGEWVTVENILAYAQLHELSVMPCPSGQVTTLAYEKLSGHTVKSVVKRNVSEGDAYRYVEKPGLLAGFFLFASLGWLDIAYVNPPGAFGDDHFSAFDGLKAVRLNSLGAHIAGRVKGDYTPKVNTATQELRFDNQSLLIFCDPENVVAETILANYAERVSPTRFRVTASTFLKDCKSKQQLVSKISLFTKSIAPDLPANWQAFFDELTGKAEPLKPVTNLKVYLIPANDGPLIRLLAQDAVLKTMVVKAEGFRILIADDQLAKFKNRLRELGYLIS